MRIIPLLSFFFLFCPGQAQSAHLYKEKEYQKAWCSEMGGIQEYVLEDATRVDCMADGYAVEVDFAPKWAESAGQSLYYALRTGLKPGVLLILENSGDERYLERLSALAEAYRLKIWTITPTSLASVGGKAPMRASEE